MQIFGAILPKGSAIIHPDNLNSSEQLANEMLLMELEISIKNHDKYYDYSDSYVVFKKGEQEWKHIQSLSNELKMKGYTSEVSQLFDKYYNGV